MYVDTPANAFDGKRRLSKKLSANLSSDRISVLLLDVGPVIPQFDCFLITNRLCVVTPRIGFRHHLLNYAVSRSQSCIKCRNNLTSTSSCTQRRIITIIIYAWIKFRKYFYKNAPIIICHNSYLFTCACITVCICTHLNLQPT